MISNKTIFPHVHLTYIVLQWEKIKLYIYIYIYMIPCWFCTFAHWQRNDQSTIVMVGLFEH